MIDIGSHDPAACPGEGECFLANIAQISGDVYRRAQRNFHALSV
jgi:hypothetical protein